METPWVMEYLKLYKFFEKGCLPVTGGLLNQVGTFIDAMDIVSSVKGAVEKRENLNG